MDQEIVTVVATVVAIAAGLTPLTTILTEAVKDTGELDSKLVPFASLFLGTITGAVVWLLPGHEVPIAMLLIGGFVSGAMASGLYDRVTKNK